MPTDPTLPAKEPRGDQTERTALPPPPDAPQVAPIEPPPAPPEAPPKYLPERQARRPFNFRGSIGQLGATFWHLLKHTLGTFEPAPHAATDISLTAPAGKIRGDQVAVCREIAAESVARLDKLEQKSTTLLSVIAVVAPLTASAAVFIKQQSLPKAAGAITLGLDVLATVAVLLAFVAVLRALAVRGHQALFLNTVIDPESDRIRDYDEDFYGRGLLYTAAHRQAVCDHIADFVRAAQVFLVLGVALASLASLPVLFAVHDSPTHVVGTVGLDASTLRGLRAGFTEDARLQDARVARLESVVDSLASLKAANDDIRHQIESLRVQIRHLSPHRGATAPRGGKQQ